jgi:hypothetical protein
MDDQCQQTIQALSDKELVQQAFDDFFGRYTHEGHSIALQYAQLRQLRDARDVLTWNPIKRLVRAGDVAEARGRLRGWLFERVCRG